MAVQRICAQVISGSLPGYLMEGRPNGLLVRSCLVRVCMFLSICERRCSRCSTSLSGLLYDSVVALCCSGHSYVTTSLKDDARTTGISTHKGVYPGDGRVSQAVYGVTRLSISTHLSCAYRHPGGPLLCLVNSRSRALFILLLYRRTRSQPHIRPSMRQGWDNPQLYVCCLGGRTRRTRCTGRGR